jgi:molybdopterin/thiamine biosynthesis adenylyltransferase
MLQSGRLHNNGLRLLGESAGIRQNVESIAIPRRIFNMAFETLSLSHLETQVFLFGKVKGSTLLATDILIPKDDDYEVRNYGCVKVSNDFVLREFPKIEKQGKTQVATIHSHCLDTLSAGDIQTHLNVIRFYPHHLSGIFNQSKIRFFKFDGGLKEVPYQLLDLERFDRQILIFGQEGQLMISTSTIALIGCGGGNTKIAFDLASLGIGKLILIDPDYWEESNRNRALILPDHVSMPKVQSVKEIIERHYPDVKVDAHKARVEDVAEDVLSEADILVIGPDKFLTREYCNKLALRMNKKAIFVGAGIKTEDGKVKDMGGSVQTVIPNESPCFQCVHTPDPLTIIRETSSPEIRKKLAKKYGVPLDVDVTPSIVFLNDVIAGLAIQEIIKLITGFDKPVHYKVYDALNDRVDRIKISKDENCLACGKISDINEKEVKKQTKPEDEILSAKKGGNEKCQPKHS